MHPIAKIAAIALASMTTAAPFATIARADTTSDYLVGFGPFIGGGTASNDATVRHASGYGLTLERNWFVTPKIAIGPRLEVANQFVSTRANADDASASKVIGTYDNRIFAAGFRLSHAVGNEHTLAQGVYLAGVAGRGYSKLSLDESTQQSYMQSQYGNIAGNYFAGELGGFLPLKGSFGVNLAALGSIYRADQRDAIGTSEGDRVDENGALSLVKTTHAAGDGSLEDRLVFKSWAVKLGMSLGF
jgi:hypothetical protein